MPDNLYYIELAWEKKVPQEKILNKFKINLKKVLKCAAHEQIVGWIKKKC